MNQVISTTGFEPRGRPKVRATASPPLWSNGPRLHGGKPHRLCARGKPRGYPIIYWLDKMARDGIGQVHGLPSLKDFFPRSALLNITIPTAPRINSGKETRPQGYPLPSKRISHFTISPDTPPPARSAKSFSVNSSSLISPSLSGALPGRP